DGIDTVLPRKCNIASSGFGNPDSHLLSIQNKLKQYALNTQDAE
ncbi:MAG: hypothetical protein ACD_75C00440G0001, partial [uncultured bacterium]